MKRTISLWIGLLAFAMMPVFAQPGGIHGKVIGPEGAPRTSGSVSLSTDKHYTSIYTFRVTSSGDYSGQADPGVYTVVYRAPDTPPDKFIDSIIDVQVLSGQDTMQDIDMSRSEFIDKLPAAQQRQLEELKKRNAVAMQTNEIIKILNEDLRICAQDFTDAESAPDAETKAAKYSEAETLLLKDTQMKPDASILWIQLGLAQVGLMKYAEAEASFTNALDLEHKSSHPNVRVQSVANAQLSNIRANIGNVARPDSASAVTPPPAPAARQYDEVAPPPTPPAPAPTITIGELKAQVLTDFGEPQRKAATGPKEIYFYTDLKMKVTFVNGKVSSID
jgi:hypothetical protein